MDGYEHEHVVVPEEQRTPELDIVSLCVFASDRTQILDVKKPLL